MPNGFAIAVDYIFAHPIIFVAIIGVIFAIWIGKKLLRKYYKKKNIQPKELFPEIVEFEDDFETIKEKPTVIQWRGKRPEPVPEPEQEIYECENCPESRLHTKSMIFQCPDCKGWFCDKHISQHIYKKHRSKDYVVSSDENFVASYTRGR